MKIKLLLILSIFTVIAFSCKNEKAKKVTEKPLVVITEGDKLIGEWKIPNSKWTAEMIISKEGNSYLVKIYSISGLGETNRKEYLTTHEDGAFKFEDSQIPDIKYAEDKNTIYWVGESYKRKK